VRVFIVLFWLINQGNRFTTRQKKTLEQQDCDYRTVFGPHSGTLITKKNFVHRMLFLDLSWYLRMSLYASCLFFYRDG